METVAPIRTLTDAEVEARARTSLPRATLCREGQTRAFRVYAGEIVGDLAEIDAHYNAPVRESLLMPTAWVRFVVRDGAWALDAIER